MTISATYTKIASLTAATSGIGSAPEAMPIALPESTGGFPFSQVLVGPASWNEHASGLYRQVRTYSINVYVKAVSEGVTPDEGYKACLTPLYNLGRTFVQNMTLDGVADGVGTGDRPEFQDSGVTVLTYAGRDYHGFTLTMEITEKAS